MARLSPHPDLVQKLQLARRELDLEGGRSRRSPHEEHRRPAGRQPALKRHNPVHRRSEALLFHFLVVRLDLLSLTASSVIERERSGFSSIHMRDIRVPTTQPGWFGSADTFAGAEAHAAQSTPTDAD